MSDFVVVNIPEDKEEDLDMNELKDKGLSKQSVVAFNEAPSNPNIASPGVSRNQLRVTHRGKPYFVPVRQKIGLTTAKQASDDGHEIGKVNADDDGFRFTPKRDAMEFPANSQPSSDQ